MDLKSRIEASNCLIKSEWNNNESFGKESRNEDFVLKKCVFIRFFSFSLYWKSLIFMYPNNYTLWRIWSSRIFFFKAL